MLDKKKNRPDLESEMDELQRVVQDLSRDENIEITVDQLVDAFNKSSETTLTDEIWKKLENTESNEITKDNWKAVFGIAKRYNKTNPEKLKKSIEKGTYKRPLIINFGDRYHLVAGNTRLSTASAMGVNPKVFIAKIDTINESEEIKGGLADNKTLVQIAKKHDAKGYYHINNMVDSLKEQLKMGLKVEMEHTNDKDKAKEIALDHLWEDPSYYSKLKKIETKESMGADSSGSFVGPILSTPILKKDLYKQHNTKKYNVNEEEEFTEAMDASSAGGYDVPLFGGTKGRKNPLKISGEKSIKSSRAVKDKNFPKWGGPEGVYIKIKEKCKKYPYCNQGDINAVELLEIDGLTEAIKETSQKLGIPYSEVEKIVLKEIKQIFI
jgi:hypothetical protein